ncbi:MAG: AsmA-like C-terminal region-containing protein [Luteolibacter sp.]|jgi:hypothetical protein|nr:AsmA-like C-terminal region-containing protein [Luteolibacter sp.]
MYHLHFTRNLRSLGFLLIAAAVIAGIWMLWWANRTGLPESWRSAIERQISRQGAHVEVGALRYHPLRGVIASKVRIFSDPARRHEISKLERVLLDFDKTKLARGILHLNKIELRDAALTLPVEPDVPASENLEVTGLNGTLLMPGSRRFEVRDARGRIAGIEVSLNARLVGYHQAGDSPTETSNAGKRRKLIARIIKELGQWHFEADNPPRVGVFLEGNANDNASLTAKLTLHANDLEKNQHGIEELSAEAEITGDLLTLTKLRIQDSRGLLEGRVDYDLGERAGRFDLKTSLEIAPLLTAWLGLPPLSQIVIGGGQALEAEGEFHIDERNIPHISMTGHASAESVMLRGTRFDVVESAFAWGDGGLFLRDLRLSRPDGLAKGKALIQWPLVRLALQSTLPAAVYKPFFAGQPLEIVAGDFSERKGASFDVRLEGGFDATDRHSWAYTGGGTVQNVNYKGVPVDSAECRFSLSHHELDFFDGTVIFNYRNYPLREAFGGPNQATAKVGRIRYAGDEKVVEVEDVSGDIWAAPLVRLFAPTVADSLEIYRFHRPPTLKGSGVVDVTPRGRTALEVSFNSPDAADYRFLGENITLSQPVGKVLIRGPRVTVAELKLNAFDGPISGQFDFRGDGKLSGELSWTQLSIPALTSTYGFQVKGGGETTGRLDFALTDGRVETMSGVGLFALEKTELFSVPMFGPLSTVASNVLNDRRAGFERAKSAFCNFRIEKGVLRTEDFQTATTSLTFAGEGEVDLAKRTLDMTMRMNARGLLGLITLPLRPFYGMFQFRGTGPLKNPQWENVMFTAPPEGQKELLQAAPKARIVPVKD